MASILQCLSFEKTNDLWAKLYVEIFVKSLWNLNLSKQPWNTMKQMKPMKFHFMVSNGFDLSFHFFIIFSFHFQWENGKWVVWEWTGRNGPSSFEVELEPHCEALQPGQSCRVACAAFLGAQRKQRKTTTTGPRLLLNFFFLLFLFFWNWKKVEKLKKRKKKRKTDKQK